MGFGVWGFRSIRRGAHLGYACSRCGAMRCGAARDNIAQRNVWCARKGGTHEPLPCVRGYRRSRTPHAHMLRSAAKISAAPPRVCAENESGAAESAPPPRTLSASADGWSWWFAKAVPSTRMRTAGRRSSGPASADGRARQGLRCSKACSTKKQSAARGRFARAKTLREHGIVSMCCRPICRCCCDPARAQGVHVHPLRRVSISALLLRPHSYTASNAAGTAHLTLGLCRY